MKTKKTCMDEKLGIRDDLASGTKRLSLMPNSWHSTSSRRFVRSFPSDDRRFFSTCFLGISYSMLPLLLHTFVFHLCGHFWTGPKQLVAPMYRSCNFSPNIMKHIHFFLKTILQRSLRYMFHPFSMMTSKGWVRENIYCIRLHYIAQHPRGSWLLAVLASCRLLPGYRLMACTIFGYTLYAGYWSWCKCSWSQGTN